MSNLFAHIQGTRFMVETTQDAEGNIVPLGTNVIIDRVVETQEHYDAAMNEARALAEKQDTMLLCSSSIDEFQPAWHPLAGDMQNLLFIEKMGGLTAASAAEPARVGEFEDSLLALIELGLSATHKSFPQGQDHRAEVTLEQFFTAKVKHPVKHAARQIAKRAAIMQES